MLAPSGPTEAANMPIFKCPQKSEPLWKEWDKKAQKNGLRHQVFVVNGDHYVGEWKDNMKHGKWGVLGGSGGEYGVWVMVDHWGQGSSLQSSLGT